MNITISTTMTDVTSTGESCSKNTGIDKTMDYQYKEMSIETLREMLDSNDISKNQKKKIKKQIKWLETAVQRKEIRKQRKLRYKEMRLQNPDGYVKRQKLEKITTKQNFESHLHIAIDLSFNDLMTNKDLRKLGKQIGWCYQVNRRSVTPVQYHLCGLKGRLKSIVDPSHVNWDVHFDEDLFDNSYTDTLVYLTAESPNVLTDLEMGKVYVIGGLVDHNHQKGVCQKLAESKGVKTYRLPLEENIDIKTRRVLTVNHVFEILLAFIELREWKSAILKVLPAKKLTVEKKAIANESVDNSDDSSQAVAVDLKSTSGNLHFHDTATSKLPADDSITIINVKTRQKFLDNF